MSKAGAFGESLKRHRELRGIPLKTVAEKTKISPTFLIALERGDCSKWPGGIYSRAWIRAYATAIGQNPEEVASEFTRCFVQTAFPNGEPVPPPPKPAGIPKVSPFRLTLEPDPHERTRLIRRRLAFLVADIFIAVAIAVTLSKLGLFEFWTVFAASTVTCHAVGLIGGGGSAAGWAQRRLRRHARPVEGEEAVAEAA